MTDDKSLSDETQSSDNQSIDEELVAYLDGELDPETSRRVDRRLAEDPLYRARLSNLQRAWDLLDNLQRPEADEEFTRSTVAMVTVRAADDVHTDNLAIRRGRTLQMAGLAAVGLVAAGIGYGLFYHRITRPNRELVRDLPVIENVDEYRNVESMDFLQRLQKEGLFAAEVENGM